MSPITVLIHSSARLLLQLAAAQAVGFTLMEVLAVRAAAVVGLILVKQEVDLVGQEPLVKETLAVTPLVVEAAQLGVVAAAPEVWVLLETLHKVKVVQEYQLELPEVQSRMQVVAAEVVGL